MTNFFIKVIGPSTFDANRRPRALELVQKEPAVGLHRPPIFGEPHCPRVGQSQAVTFVFGHFAIQFAITDLMFRDAFTAHFAEEGIVLTFAMIAMQFVFPIAAIRVSVAEQFLLRGFDIIHAFAAPFIGSVQTVLVPVASGALREALLDQGAFEGLFLVARIGADRLVEVRNESAFVSVMLLVRERRSVRPMMMRMLRPESAGFEGVFGLLRLVPQLRIARPQLFGRYCLNKLIND